MLQCIATSHHKLAITNPQFYLVINIRPQVFSTQRMPTSHLRTSGRSAIICSSWNSSSGQVLKVSPEFDLLLQKCCSIIRIYILPHGATNPIRKFLLFRLETSIYSPPQQWLLPRTKSFSQTMRLHQRPSRAPYAPSPPHPSRTSS